MNIKTNNQLNKLIKNTISFFHANSEKLPQLSHDDYLLLSEFNSLMDLVNIVLLLSDDTEDDERYCVMHLLSHGLIQYQVEYENAVTYKTDFTLAQSIESLISRQLRYFNLNGFFAAREIISALFSANIKVNEDFLTELNNAEYLCDAHDKNEEEVGFEDLIFQFEQMVTSFEANSDYEIYLQIAEQLNQMPAEAGQLMFNSMLQTKNSLSRDASVLLLLHPLAKVRDNILEGLSLFATQGLLNAKDYNRLLTLRNWLGDYDKKIVDNSIKLIQKSQISFEHDITADKKNIHNILLTPTDNGGCMALQIAFKQSRHFIVFGCVLKQNFGIKDVFITDFLNKSHYQQLLLEASNGLPMCSISFEQFEILLSHFLKLNLIQKNNIPAEVLLLKEYTGANWLQPRLIDLTLVETYLKKANKNLQPTFEVDDFIIGWASPEYLVNHQSINAIIKQEFEPYRLAWYERLKLTCFCFAEHINNIQVFIESARQIKAAQKLTKINLFQEIAEQVLLDSFFADDGDALLSEDIAEFIEQSKQFESKPLERQAKKRPGRAVYQIKIHLTGSKPAIWRRLLVMNNISLRKLHHIIQIAMGWNNHHLYEFEFEHCQFGPPNEFDPNVYNDKLVQLRDCLIKEKSQLNYLYDFGDCWQHKIILEKILPAQKKNTPIQIIKGVGACPPENVGGISGYARLLDILKNKQHPEYEQQCEWLSINFEADFDPAELNLEDLNEVLMNL